jgi:hypothetical protein
MSSNPEVDGILAFRPELAEAEPPPPILVPVEPVQETPAVPSPVVAAARRGRPGWVLPVALGAVGLIASSTLAYFLYSTVNQRDAVQHQLVATRATLASTQQDLSTAKSDAAAKKAVATYVSLYVVDNGRVQTDFASVANCDNYSQCRTSSQQLLADMQSFQSDRSAAIVPPSLANADSMLGDALSAAIAGDQELISGLDNGDNAKIKEGFRKVNVAMLSAAKAESALGGAIR